MARLAAPPDRVSDALNIARIEAGFIIANMDFIPADQAVREDRVRSPV